jgi:UDP-N-acetylglucosamine 2-epimerase
LHPQDANEDLEFRRARMILKAVQGIPFERIIICYPNNDPGSRGIIRFWESQVNNPRMEVYKNIPRNNFVGLLRDAVVLVGNSSSGIIEAASFATPVVDVGNRQLGRERCKDVRNVPYGQAAIYRAIRRIWNKGKPLRGRCDNPYEMLGTAQAITRILQETPLNTDVLKKIINY